jgi:DNA-directed RNA polymerase subunit RPC12/RpoP
MRLINADALEKTLRDWIRDHWTEAFTGDDAGAEFADIIDHAKTIDANPTVPAHWIERRANNGNMHYVCSHCGKEVSYPYAKKRWKYCIECGAKMGRGGRQLNIPVNEQETVINFTGGSGN